VKKVLLMPDSFKGTITSAEICEIMSVGIKKHFPACKTVSVPVADGGEGSADSFLSAIGGKKICTECADPFFNRIGGYFALLDTEMPTAVIELAIASGITLAAKALNPEITTTYGVGELIKAALDHGAKKIILALGGSSTNDFGCGAAAALGVRFLNKKGECFIPTGGTLCEVEKIDLSKADKRLEKVELVSMCDVSNPAYGEKGAAYVFAPQKGADDACVKRLDSGLRHICGVVSNCLNKKVDELPGGGAAGAMGAGMYAFFGFKLMPGIDILLDTVNIEQLAQNADMIITGEGCIDPQTLGGKVISGISCRAKKLGIPVMAVVGGAKEGIDEIYDRGVCAVFTTNRLPRPLSEDTERCKSDLAFAFDNIIRLIKMKENR